MGQPASLPSCEADKVFIGDGCLGSGSLSNQRLEARIYIPVKKADCQALNNTLTIKEFKIW